MAGPSDHEPSPMPEEGCDGEMSLRQLPADPSLRVGFRCVSVPNAWLKAQGMLAAKQWRSWDRISVCWVGAAEGQDKAGQADTHVAACRSGA